MRNIKRCKCEKRLKKFLYHSGILREDEVVDFKTAYLLLRQEVVKNRVGRLAICYETILRAISRDSKIQVAFYGILKCKSRKTFDRYCEDIRKIKKLPNISIYRNII